MGAKSLALAGFSGGFSAVFSNPFFLLKTRMQSASSCASMVAGKTSWDPNLGMSGVAREIYRSEGMMGFTRGMPALILRVSSASAAQLATYDVAKTSTVATVGPILMRFGVPELNEHTFTTHFISAWMSSLAMVVTMQPFDFAATRMSNGGCGLYTSSFAVIRDTVRGPEGFFGIFKGMWANYM